MRAGAHVRSAPWLALSLAACGGTLLVEPAPPVVALHGVPLVYVIASGDADVETLVNVVAGRVTASPGTRLQRTSEAQLAAERAAGFVPPHALSVSLVLQVAHRTEVDWPDRDPPPGGLPPWHAPPPPNVMERGFIEATLALSVRDATTQRVVRESTFVHRDPSDDEPAVRAAAAADFETCLRAAFASPR